MAASDAIATDPATAPKAAKNKADKHTYMLHDPRTLACLGKFRATHDRYAALKAASAAHRPNSKLTAIVDDKGVAHISSRRTNTRLVRKYEGRVVPLKEPKVVKRGDEEVVYTRKPTATYVGNLDISVTDLTSLDTLVEDAEGGEDNKDVPLANVPAAVLKKRKTTRKT